MEETPELISLLGEIEILQMDDQDDQEREALKRKAFRSTMFWKMDLPEPVSLRDEVSSRLTALAGLPASLRKPLLRSLVYDGDH